MYALCVVPVILYVYKTAWEDSAKDIAISMDVAVGAAADPELCNLHLYISIVIFVNSHILLLCAYFLFVLPVLFAISIQTHL